LVTILTALHILVCLFLIAIVLLQRGKGADLGAAFGGSSSTLFGSRGAATFLNKITTVAAVVFMLTSLVLTMVTSKGTSVVKDVAPVEQQKALPQQIPQQPQDKAPQQAAPQQPATK
jgi:preprotein translocase subunit SecG